VVTAMIPEPEPKKEGSSNSKNLMYNFADSLKDKNPIMLQLVEEGKVWDSYSFIEELKSKFVCFLEGEYSYYADTNTPDVISIKYGNYEKPIYEARRDESGIIHVTELSTGEIDPDYLKISKEDANTPPRRFVEVLPEPIGGMEFMNKYLQENMTYPPEAREKKITGQVFLEFVVEKDGSISNVKVIKSVHPLLDAEAVRAIKQLPKWKPGMQNGKPVRTYFSIPVRFTIN